MTARDEVLGLLRARRAGRPAEAATVVDERLRAHPRNLIPTRAQLAAGGLHALFCEMAQASAATVAEVPTLDDVPAAVAEFLAGANLPAALRAAPALRDLPWAARPTLSVGFGKPDPDELVGLSLAASGIAETGTLLLASGVDSPSTLNFLPDTHLVVLPASCIVASYEDAFDRLRAAGPVPRTVNLITGPSRTGDIEQTILMGAHGPRRLHILLVDDA